MNSSTTFSISTTQLLPQLTQELLGYDATTAGLTLGLGSIITLFIMPLAGVVTGRFVEPKYLVFMALLGTAGAPYHASRLTINIAFLDASLSRALQVVRLPFIVIPLSAVQFTEVPPGKNPDASALINLMRNLGGSWGVSVAPTELQWRNQFHHARLAEHITPFNGYGFATSLSGIAQRVQAQATILSYLDVFLILAVVALCVAPLSLFLPKMPKGAPAGGH